MDWANRAVLALRLSNTMDASLCVWAPEEALARASARLTSSTLTRPTNSPAAPAAVTAARSIKRQRFDNVEEGLGGARAFFFWSLSASEAERCPPKGVQL
jgi:hypothetical protein